MSFVSRFRHWALAGGAIAALVLSACGGGADESAPTSSSAPPQAPVATAATSGPGTITLSSTAIEGQEGKVLLVFIAAEGGGPTANACLRVESGSFSAPATQVTDMPAGENPCGGETEVTTFPEGRYTLTAGIYTPPSQVPDKQVAMTVTVRGDVAVVIDGSNLSR